MKYVKRGIGVLIVLTAVVWGVDWLILYFKVSRNKDTAFGQVEVRHRYAVHLKNKQIEYRFEKPKMEECVNSLFPHYDESACWYLARHTDQIIDLDGGPWHFYNP